MPVVQGQSALGTVRARPACAVGAAWNGMHVLSLRIQSNFNGSNTFGTMKICPRQGYFEPLRVDLRARLGGIIRISLIFYNMKVCCVF